MNQIVKKWEKLGTVKLAPFGTSHNTPLFALPLKNGNGDIVGVKRPVFDGRALNNQLVENDRFEIPSTRMLMDKLGEFKVIDKEL